MSLNNIDTDNSSLNEIPHLLERLGRFDEYDIIVDRIAISSGPDGAVEARDMLFQSIITQFHHEYAVD